MSSQRAKSSPRGKREKSTGRAQSEAGGRCLIYTRADGKRVRRIYKTNYAYAKDMRDEEIYTRQDGTRVRLVARREGEMYTRSDGTRVRLVSRQKIPASSKAGCEKEADSRQVPPVAAGFTENVVSSTEGVTDKLQVHLPLPPHKRSSIARDDDSTLDSWILVDRDAGAQGIPVKVAHSRSDTQNVEMKLTNPTDDDQQVPPADAEITGGVICGTEGVAGKLPVHQPFPPRIRSSMAHGTGSISDSWILVDEDTGAQDI